MFLRGPVNGEGGEVSQGKDTPISKIPSPEPGRMSAFNVENMTRSLASVVVAVGGEMVNRNGLGPSVALSSGPQRPSSLCLPFGVKGECTKSGRRVEGPLLFHRDDHVESSAAHYYQGNLLTPCG